MKNTDGLRGHLAALFTILVWGTTYISSKVLLRSFTLTEVAFLRYLVAYGALWLVWPHRLRLPNRRDELLFAGAGLCGITLYSLFEMAALARTMTANVSVIVSTAPFFTAGTLSQPGRARISSFGPGPSPVYITTVTI